jgi:alpha-tubulin suppressor-like RCC1 family protein
MKTKLTHGRLGLAGAMVALVMLSGLLGSGLAAGATATAAAAGQRHTCAVTSDGAVVCWGWNVYGGLGDGTTTDRLTPVPVVGLTSGAVAVTAGDYHACALTSGGAVQCWGGNQFGQLGDGTTTNRLTPVTVSGLTTGVVAVTAGDYHTCARTSGGAVQCWGANFNGRLGDGTTVDHPTPVAVNGLTSGVVTVAAGAHHTCAVASGGAAWCWGANFNGQLGDGTTIDAPTPVAVSGLTSGVAAVAPGLYHSCAVTIAGAVRCWGNNANGQLGEGSALPAFRTTPVPVAGLGSSVVAVTAGEMHTCASTSAGAVFCWGGNNLGQLGDGTTTGRLAPTPVTGLGSAVAGIAAGWWHTCALTTGGRVLCWGYNGNGGLGDGTTTDRHSPVTVTGLGPTDGPRVIALSGSLAFGDVTVGATATRTLTIANSGNSALTVTGITYPAGFTGAWSGTIPAGGSQAVTVTFAPTAVASYSGPVTVGGDQTSGANTTAVSGSGRAPGPLSASPPTLRFGATKAGAAGSLTTVTCSQPVTVSFAGAGTSWTATTGKTWLQLTNATGAGDGQFTVGLINPGNVIGGATSLTGTVTVTAGLQTTSLTVRVAIDQAGTSAPPFGQVDTPTQNATGIVGAIGVTGWALDDGCVTSVKIYRNCVGFEDPANCQFLDGASVVYIGNAAFLAGARPDVEAAFPTYPQPYRAGWGYLMLTNMLPDVPGGRMYGGQGTLSLYAFAFDGEGKRTLLGRSWLQHTPTSIAMTNHTITKPFGAIDTPNQGQTVSGTLANFGWALTPDSNTVEGGGAFDIPIGGSTMTVFVDGVAIGNVGYNQCRGTVGNPVPSGLYCDDDVANIFGNPTPQPTFTTRTSNPTRYRNLDAGRAAIGAFEIDTTALANGLHTIAWGVLDSAGRPEGIGSRFFTVLNSTAADSSVAADRTNSADAESLAVLSEAPAIARGDARSIRSLPTSSSSVLARTGFDLGRPLETASRGEDGVLRLLLAELGRLELQMGPVEAGHLVANGTLRDLPPGSRLDTTTGEFTWMPGPGYLGTYQLAFVRRSEQVRVEVTIRPTRPVTPGQSEIRMSVDTPRANNVVVGPVTVAGWALDPQAAIGSGIGQIDIWAQRRDVPGAKPVFLGTAALDGERLDVARVYGAQFNRAGYGLVANGLAPGRYDITVFAWNRRTARWEDARTVTVEAR